MGGRQVPFLMPNMIRELFRASQLRRERTLSMSVRNGKCERLTGITPGI